MKLWLDDIRTPPDGWLWVKTNADAKLHLEAGHVEMASLDHDLGACDDCMGGRTVEQFMADHENQAMPHCEHVGTGYDLCLWMAETGHWPSMVPHVHSMNPAGAERMRGVIARYFGLPAQAEQGEVDKR